MSIRYRTVALSMAGDAHHKIQILFKRHLAARVYYLDNARCNSIFLLAKFKLAR